MTELFFVSTKKRKKNVRKIQKISIYFLLYVFLIDGNERINAYFECHIDQHVDKLTLNVYRKNEMNMKNRLLRNGSVSRRCWLPSFAFSLKKNCQVVQQTRVSERERARGRASLFCVLPNQRRKVVVGRKRDDAKNRKERKEYIYIYVCV